MASTPDGKQAWGGWKKSPVADPHLLEDVMSQELAEQLHKEEQSRLVSHASHEQIHQTSFSASLPQHEELIWSQQTADRTSEETANDFLVAQMLQLEFDKEADMVLKREEEHFNKGSKVSISLQKYRNIHPLQQSEVYSDQEEAEEFEPEGINLQFSKKTGVRGVGKNMVTKHDSHICSRKNANNAMEKLSLDVETGDGDAFDMRLPNGVYNQLRSHSIAEGKRAARLHEKKDQSTATHAVDQKTRLLLFKMLNSGLLREVHGVIYVGKESAVLHATGGQMEDGSPVPEECALKVFKTTLAEFKSREKYVRGDYRLANEFKKQNPRKIMRMWAEKEMLNLKRMAKFAIPCPEVIKLKKHVLVMTFLGCNQVPAPKLRDAHLTSEKLAVAYEQVIQGMKDLYKKCCLVHADLSEYNMLWHDDRVFFIDVSQAVDLTHPLAHEFLLRDCQNVSHFFSKCGLQCVASGFDIFNAVTGMELRGSSEEHFLQQIQEYEKEQLAYQLNAERKEFAFNLMFDKRRDATESDTASDESDNDGSRLSVSE